MSDLTVTPLGAGRFLVTGGARSVLAFAVVEADRTWVHVDGFVHVIARTEGRTAAQGLDESGLVSPMPATVVDIRVTPGQRVARGDVLMMLEAMKMELPIRAPRDGTVKSLSCRPGELVQPGVPLLELDHES